MQDAQVWLIDAIRITGLALALWLLASPVGWGLRWLTRQAMPNGPTDYTTALWSSIPGHNRPHEWLSDRLAQLRMRLVGARRVRVGVDGLHRALAARLVALRSDLARDLSAIVQGGARGDGTLVGLLKDFNQASEKAHKFETIDEDLPDQSSEISLARSRFFWSIFASFVIATLNCGLLLIFFREFQTGIEFPGTRIDVVNGLAFVLPFAEFLTGFLPALNTDEDKARGSAAIVTKLVIGGSLAALEGFIFYALFLTITANMLDNGASTSLQTVAPYLPLVGALVGVGLVLLQTTAGDGAGRNRQRLKRAIPIQAIKDQVRDANAFVDGLPQRYAQIDGKAIQARQSVKNFLASVRSQNEEEAPVVGKLERARENLLDALASVDPTMWSPDGPAGEGDRDDALRMAWGSILLLIAPVLFIVLASWIFMAMPGFSSNPTVAIASALGLALGGFLLLPALVPRTALIVEEGRQARRWLPGGGGVERGLAIGYAVLVTAALLGVAIYSQGWQGFITGAVALALLAPAAWLGGSWPQLLAGLSFLVQALVEFSGFLLLLAWVVLRAILLAALWIILMIATGVAAIVALPMTLLLALRRRRASLVSAGRTA